jgi:hypothetical protein
VQWTPPGDNRNNLLWTFLPLAPGGNEFNVINANSGLALAVDGASTEKGAEIVQWPTPGDNPKNLSWKLGDLTFSVTVGAGEFSFAGTGYVSGDTVTVTSSFESDGAPVSGGPYTYVVAADGSFGGLISVDYFQSAGTLTVNAVDKGLGYPYNLSWEGPAGG